MKKILEHPLFTLMGLLSSIIGIFAFVTGISDIGRFFDNSNKNSINKKTIKINQEIVVDENKNQYRTFKQGNLFWVSKNINTADEESTCYNNENSNCLIYGRLYSYDAATRVCNKLGKGWRLPTLSEFKSLLLSNNGGFNIRTGMFSEPETFGNIENGYKNISIGGITGFNALKGGFMYYNPIFPNQFDRIGGDGFFWASPDIQNNKGDVFYFAFSSNYFQFETHEKEPLGLTSYFSCRCVLEDVISTTPGSQNIARTKIEEYVIFEAPSVIDMPLDEVKIAIIGAGLRIGREIKVPAKKGQSPGTVVKQNPNEGVNVRIGDVIDLWVTTKTVPVETPGNGIFKNPNVIGMPLDEAKITIIGAGLRTGREIKVPAKNGQWPGTVVKQNPDEGMNVRIGDVVDFWVTED